MLHEMSHSIDLSDDKTGAFPCRKKHVNDSVKHWEDWITKFGKSGSMASGAGIVSGDGRGMDSDGMRNRKMIQTNEGQGNYILELSLKDHNDKILYLV